jgi:diguanylate cyclase (GGDEF)-like protein
LHATRDASGQVPYLEATLVDTTARRVLAEQLRGLPEHDHLTGAATAGLLRERLARALAGRDRATGVALLRIDLDGFHRVVELYGHLAGDRALVITAQRLRAIVRDQDLVARFGADDFAVLCQDVEPGAAERLGQRISRGLGAVVGGGIGRVAASVAVATARADDTPEDLLNRSEAVLRVVKTAGGGGWAVD